MNHGCGSTPYKEEHTQMSQAPEAQTGFAPPTHHRPSPHQYITAFHLTSTSPPSCPVAKSRPPPLVPVPPVPPAALDSQQHADTRPASLSSGHKGFLAWAFSEARSFCDL
eukprot:1160453-Pelagomonas_calceolata.AAC.18